MEFDQLATFLAVLEHHSFARAARALHLSQSTVSFQIKALESTVGGRILQRGSGPVRATASGRALERHARKLVAAREEALAEMHAQENGLTGHLKLCASSIPGEYLLPPALAEFKRLHPRIHIEVSICDSRHALAALHAHECELAFVGSRPRDKRLVSPPFARDEIVLVGPVPNPFAPKGKLTLRELEELPLVLREDGSGTRDAVASILAELGAHPRHAPLCVSNTQSAKLCVMAGAGLAFLSRVSVAEGIRLRVFSEIELPGLPLERRFHAVRWRSEELSRPARGLLDLVLQRSRSRGV